MALRRKDPIVAKLERELAERLDLVKQAKRFGTDDEWPDASVLAWTRTFHNGVTYTYVAVKSGPDSWWMTGRTMQASTFDDLVAVHLVNADEVLVVTDYEVIP